MSRKGRVAAVMSMGRIFAWHISMKNDVKVASVINVEGWVLAPDNTTTGIIVCCC